jgi:hypothetical protein
LAGEGTLFATDAEGEVAEEEAGGGDGAADGEESGEEDDEPGVGEPAGIDVLVQHGGEDGCNAHGGDAVEDVAQAREGFGAHDAIVEVGVEGEHAVAVALGSKVSWGWGRGFERVEGLRVKVLTLVCRCVATYHLWISAAPARETMQSETKAHQATMSAAWW